MLLSMFKKIKLIFFIYNKQNNAIIGEIHNKNNNNKKIKNIINNDYYNNYLNQNIFLNS